MCALTENTGCSTFLVANQVRAGKTNQSVAGSSHRTHTTHLCSSHRSLRLLTQCILGVLGGMHSEAAFCPLHPCPQSLLYRCRLLSGVGEGGRSCISTQVPASEKWRQGEDGASQHTKEGGKTCCQNIRRARSQYVQCCGGACSFIEVQRVEIDKCAGARKHVYVPLPVHPTCVLRARERRNAKHA